MTRMASSLLSHFCNAYNNLLWAGSIMPERSRRRPTGVSGKRAFRPRADKQTGSGFRARCNREVWDLPILLAHRLVGWNSSCSPQAASKLAHKTNTGSDSRCCYPRLAESSDASEPMFAYEDRKVPERKRPVLSVGGGGGA